MSVNQHDEATDSPLRAFAGPSRLRGETRQARSSLSSPYARKSASGLGSYAEKPSRDSLGNAQRTPRRSNAGVDGGVSASNTAPATSSGGILSSLREAIFVKPLSWLSRGGSRSDVQPSSSSSINASPPQVRKETSVEPKTSLSSRPSAFAAPATSTPVRSSADFGLRRQLTSTPSKHPSGSQTLNTSRSLGHELRAHSPAHSNTSATAQIRSYGRERMSVEPASPRLTNSVLGTPGYTPRNGTRKAGVGSGSVSHMSNAQSSTSFAYGFGSERRLAGLGSSLSAGLSHSPLHTSTSYARLPSRSPFAMQRRSLGTALSSQRSGGRSSIAGGELGRYDASPRLANRSIGQMTTPSRPISMFASGESRAGSVAGSRASSRNATPKRREWSSLNLAPPNANRSEGEELMREYLAMRESDRSAIPAELQSSGVVMPAVDGEWKEEARSYRDADRASVTSNVTGTGAVKRGFSADPDDIMSELSQPPQKKRQMVWDAELGFVTRQEQRANQPPKPIARNEAERLLNALEGMRTPLGDAYREGNARSTTPSRDMVKVPVPLSSSSVASRPEHFVKAVSPYARAMRSNRQSASAEREHTGLRSRLRRQTGLEAGSVASSSKRDDEMSVSSRATESHAGGIEDDRSDGVESEVGSDSNAMETATDEDEPEPPRKRSGLVHRSQSKASVSEAVRSSEAASATKTLRSGKVVQSNVTPSKKSEGNKSSLSDPLENSPTSKPMSKARIGISMGSSSSSNTANKQYADRKTLFGSSQTASTNVTTRQAPAKSSTFSVRADTPSSSSESQQTRTRSSLRQGAEKTSRTHAKSGRIGFDDDADDDNSMDDSPSNEELDKINLPKNLFPTGFAFGTSTASAAPLAVEVASKPVESAPEQSQESSGDSSLLSRLGGFAPETQKTSEAPAQDISSKPTPSFSFSGPATSTAPAPAASKPLFAFQPSVSSPLATASSSSSSSPSGTSTASNFFTAPAPTANATAEKATSLTEKKDGPVPNFFASSLAKASTPPAAAAQDESKAANGTTFTFNKPADTNPTFSFGQSSQGSQPPVKDAPSSKPTFSFGQPSSTSAAHSMFGKGDAGKEEGKAAQTSTAPGNPGFGSVIQESDPGTATALPSSFSFGASHSVNSTSDAQKKRGADDGREADIEPQQKKVSFSGFSTAPSSNTATPSFSFSNPSSAGQSASASGNVASPGFSFGAAKAATEQSKPSSSFSFGNSTTSSQAQTDKPAFSFGALTATQTNDKPAFSFGAASSAATNKSNAMDASSTPSSTTNTFPSFGVPPSVPSTSLPAKPTFSFGAPQSSSPSPLPVSSPTGIAPASTGFSFGASANSNSNPATPTMNFGATSQSSNVSAPFGSSASANPFGSQDNSRQGSPAPFAFGQPQQTQQSGFGSNNGSAPTTPGFSFGAPTSINSQQQPGMNGTSNAAGGNSAFSFSMPMAATGSTGQPSFGGGPTVNSSGGSGTPPPFVFGAPTNGAAPGSQSNAFQFGQSASGMGSGATTPTQQPVGAPNSLFNIGGPSSSSPAGNRPVRGMPSRRKKA